MTDAHLRRTIACACFVCGAQPLKPCSTPEGNKLGIFCLTPRGQTPFQDWVALAFNATELYLKSQAPIAMRLPCERCGTLHIDKGHFATHPHHTHTCQNKSCGLTWRPAKEHTVGVLFIPGFQDEAPPEDLTPPPLPYSSTETRAAFWGEDRSRGLTSEGLGSQAHEVPAGKQAHTNPHTCEPVGGKDMPLTPSLHVFWDEDSIWVVAHNADDAALVYAEHVGDCSSFDTLQFSRVSDDNLIRIKMYAIDGPRSGEIAGADEDGEGIETVEQAAAYWALRGRGFLCTTDF